MTTGNVCIEGYEGWHYEDELPEGYPYDLEFSRSVVIGVRIFPPHVCDFRRAFDGTLVCKCGAWA